MERAIRNADGTMVTHAEWRAIQATSQRICSDWAKLSVPGSARGNKARVFLTKTSMRSYHAAKWHAGINALEQEHPVLKLCASNWKAEHVLGQTLAAQVQHRRKQGLDNSKVTEPENELDDTSSSKSTPAPTTLRRSPRKLPTNATKRLASPVNHTNKRQKTKTGSRKTSTPTSADEEDELIHEYDGPLHPSWCISTNITLFR